MCVYSEDLLNYCILITTNYVSMFSQIKNQIVRKSWYYIWILSWSDHIWTLKNLLTHIRFYLCMVMIYVIIIFLIINYQWWKFVCSDEKLDHLYCSRYGGSLEYIKTSKVTQLINICIICVIEFNIITTCMMAFQNKCTQIRASFTYCMIKIVSLKYSKISPCNHSDFYVE